MPPDEAAAEPYAAQEEAALALCQMRSEEQRLTARSANLAAWVRSLLMIPLILLQADTDCTCSIPRASQDAQLAKELPLQPAEVGGTLANKAVVIKESGLGKKAGLGLFAGRAFVMGDRITSYEGTKISREEISSQGLDRSYDAAAPPDGL